MIRKSSSKYQNEMKYYDQIRVKFSPTDIENAKKYKYNGSDDSICAKLFLRRYWDYLIEYFPLTMAPNLITLIGFAIEVFSFLVSFFMSDMLRQPVPWWVCFLNGISVHIYQTLDNLDGRQARRTGNSSPLGQFFDHGCDAIVGVLEMMKVAISFNFGNTSETYYFVFLMSIGFFLTAWEEYVTHSFYLGIINGPDEGLILFACAHIMAGIVPTSWSTAFALNGFSKFLFVCGFLFSTVPIIINVVKQSLEDKEKMNKAVFSLIPALITIIIFLLIAMNASQKVDSSTIERVAVPSKTEVMKSESSESSKTEESDTKKESKAEKANKVKSKKSKSDKEKESKSEKEEGTKKDSSASLLSESAKPTNTSIKSKLSTKSSASDKSSKSSDSDSDSKSSKKSSRKSEEDSDSDSKSSKKSSRKSEEDSDSDSKSSKKSSRKSEEDSDSDSKSSKKSSRKSDEDTDSDSKQSKKSSSKDSDTASKESSKSESESSLVALRAFMTPFFTMSAGLVLQYQAQQVIVNYLTLREPMRLFEPTIYILWGFAAITLLIKSFLVSSVYWVFYFLIVFAIMIIFDINVIFGFSEGLRIPILTIKPKDEEHPEDGIINENQSEEFKDVPEEDQKEVPLNIFQDVKDDL